MTIMRLAAAGVAAILLAGCAGQGDKETLGTIIGGAGGAAIGSQIGHGTGRVVATAIGGLIGAMIGQSVGKSLDEVDRLKLAQAQTEAYEAPIGERIDWSNPDTGHSGSVTPTREGTDQTTGAYCREFQHTVTIGGKTEDAYGTACRQPDGTWKIINS